MKAITAWVVAVTSLHVSPSNRIDWGHLFEKNRVQRGECNKYNVGTNYLINLDRREDRMKEAYVAFGREQITFTRISAVDGRKEIGNFTNCNDIPDDIIDPKIVSRMYNTKYNAEFDPVVPKDMNMSLCAGEIGCIYSHTNVWRMIAEKKIADPYQMTCIFEDDAKPIVDFHQSLSQVFSELPCDKPLDLLYLGYIDYFWPLVYFDFPRKYILNIAQERTSTSTGNPFISSCSDIFKSIFHLCLL